jgi:arsenate reductase
MKLRRAIFHSFLLLLAVATMNARSTGTKKRILVLCTGNSARSQMGTGFLKSFDSSLAVFSAGTEPAARVNPHAIAAMKETGIDISGEKPKGASRFTSQAFDYVITVCDEADRNCPNFLGKVGKRVHMGFMDPAAATGSEEHRMTVFRQVRDEIRQKFFEYYKNEISKGL